MHEKGKPHLEMEGLVLFFKKIETPNAVNGVYLNHLKSLGKFRGIGNVFYLMNYLKTAQVRQLKLEEIFGLKLNREETYYFFNFFPNPRKISWKR